MIYWIALCPSIDGQVVTLKNSFYWGLINYKSMEVAFFNHSSYQSSPAVMNVICLKWPECRVEIKTNSLNIANSSFAWNSFWTTLFFIIFSFRLSLLISGFHFFPNQIIILPL
jgi:hypothetical protein